MPGYDSAQKIREGDDLGRWRFAAEIAEVISSTPPDWSARIGIFGRWGEGKSTVLHFLDAMLRPEGNIVFCFNPWSAEALDELWAEFGTSLLDALKQHNLAVESSVKEMARWAQKKFESTGLSELGEGAAELFGKGRLYSSALGFVGKWLRPGGEQIKQIREHLGSKRVVVLIDDLDRATPELLPKLLLALREILDLPGFTFVLAFDDEIVGKSLVTMNEAWGNGHSFLDKILDFHYYLPPVSKAGKRLLLKNMLERYCSFIPGDSVDSIEDLLPDNPRKLKTLVRGLLSLKSQVSRHETNELNWVEIWLAQMVRQESYPFFVRLLDDDTLDQLVGIGYRLSRSDRERRNAQQEDTDDADIEEIINTIGGINERQTKRLIELINATRKLGGLQLKYNWKFALRPEALTWKEFHDLIGRWRQQPSSATISAWISEHSKNRSIDERDIEKELFETFLSAKQNEAAKAAEAQALEEHAKYCGEAEMLLTMASEFLSLPNMLTAERFANIYKSSLYWIAFRNNPADVALREAEKDLVDSLLERISDGEAPAILDALSPWDGWTFAGPEDRETTRLKTDLRNECVKQLLPKAERAFVGYLARPECFRLLDSDQGSQAFRYIFFHPACRPWGEVVRSNIFVMMQNAAVDVNDSEKTNDLLNLLTMAAENRSRFVERSSAQRIIQDREFISALWRGATSRRIQFRMQQSYLWKRNILMQLGAMDEDLPLSPELAAASERTKKANVDADEPEGDGDDDLEDPTPS